MKHVPSAKVRALPLICVAALLGCGARPDAHQNRNTPSGGGVGRTLSDADGTPSSDVLGQGADSPEAVYGEPEVEVLPAVDATVTIDLSDSVEADGVDGVDGGGSGLDGCAPIDATDQVSNDIVDASQDGAVQTSDSTVDATEDSVAIADASTSTVVCYGSGKTPGGAQMDSEWMLFCAPDNSACCVTDYVAVPCGWEACCDDPVGPGTVIAGIPVNYPCSTLPKPGPGYSKSCLMDTIPFRTCTEQRKQILAGTLPFGPCSSGGNCCPLDPACEPVVTKQLEANPPPKYDFSKPPDPTMQCDYYKHKFEAGSNASRHLLCMPGDQDCCWVYPPYGNFAPCGYDFCCQQDPSLPYGLTEASLTCAEFDKLQQPICLNNGTARYRHCNPSAQTKAKADSCGTKQPYVCCNDKSPGCENQPSVPFPKAPWE